MGELLKRVQSTGLPVTLCVRGRTRRSRRRRTLPRPPTSPSAGAAPGPPPDHSSLARATTTVASGRLVVALYAAVDMRELVPIQTSIGRPRWVPFEVVPWPTVMPWGLVGKITDRGQFRTAYRLPPTPPPAPSPHRCRGGRAARRLRPVSGRAGLLREPGQARRLVPPDVTCRAAGRVVSRRDPRPRKVVRPDPT